MPTAQTLHCPNCGAAVSSDSSKCVYCNARLATVSCPSCFGMMFIGEKFCSHCGAVAHRTETGPDGKMLCPKCGEQEMKTIQVGKSHFWECPACDGMWLDATTLQQICAEKEEQAAVIGMPTEPREPVHVDTNFKYVPCPVCTQLMNRVNFARMSGVIVDVCKAHGTWFDKDELRRLVEFIRAGGLDKARARQNADLEAQHERLKNAGNAGIPASMRAAVEGEWSSGRSDHSSVDAILDFASFIATLLK
ncbi:hypothetical protein Acid345_2517 [Candidatus Koribacter versatilis Ellin345]|uniref:Transcription factor zinc-finger domain-containing protein n=1 Tax=Koribacter versatilis (strain Ellin345) TaxID=204669 RepID=Q1INN2_KORVE|nr:hypothetical protein Acid345_2517 [Candidatus Koribacter versatilis Ellin345]